MGSFFHNLANGLLDTGKFLGKGVTEGFPGSPRNTAIKQTQQGQERLDIEKEQEARQQQEYERQLHEHMSQIGARPVVNGMVKRPLTLQDGRTIDDGLVDKADTARFVPSPSDKSVGWEIPTAEEQATRAVKLAQPGEEALTQNLGARAQATATGTGAGQLATRQANLGARGVELTGEDVNRLGLPAKMAGTRVLPEEMEQLSRGIPAAQIRNQGMLSREQWRTNSRADLQKAAIDAKTQHEHDLLEAQNRWHLATNALQAQAEGGRNARNSQRLQQSAAAQTNHLKLLNEGFGEEQRQLQAQALLDERDVPGYFGSSIGAGKEPAVADGETFVDPWTGKKQTMNYAQRLRLKNALATSGTRLDALHGQAADIEKQYGLQQSEDDQAPAGSGPNPGPSPAAPATPASATPASPASAPVKPKGTVTKAQLAAAAKNLSKPGKPVTPQMAEQAYKARGYQIAP